MGQWWSGEEQQPASQPSGGVDHVTNLFQHLSTSEYQSAASYKSATISKPKEYLNLVTLLDGELRKSGTISRIGYVGSAYKKTRINNSDFDNLFIKRDTSITSERSWNYTECVFLRDRYGNLLDPRQTLQQFTGTVQKILNKHGLTNKAKLAAHGPAIELRYNDAWSGVSFDVDLVFCYEIANDKMYTAKPPREATGQDTKLWKLSTALEEKSRMRKIDVNNKVCRRVVRIIKGGFEKDATLRVLTSYVIEQCLYHLQDTHPEDSFWIEENTKVIIREIFLFMADAVERNSLSNYYNPDERNVLPWMSDITRSNVYHRLRALSRDPKLQKFMDNA